jgi:hypothetical protein
LDELGLPTAGAGRVLKPQNCSRLGRITVELRLRLELLPVPSEPAAELADPARSQPEALGHDLGLLAQRQRPSNPPLPR